MAAEHGERTARHRAPSVAPDARKRPAPPPCERPAGGLGTRGPAVAL